MSEEKKTQKVPRQRIKGKGTMTKVKSRMPKRPGGGREMSFRGVVSSPPHEIARAGKERRNPTRMLTKAKSSSHLDALRVRPSRGWRFIRRDKLLRANDNRRRGVSTVLQLPFRGEECRGARGDGLTRGVLHRIHICFPGYILKDKKWRHEGEGESGRSLWWRVRAQPRRRGAKGGGLFFTETKRVNFFFFFFFSLCVFLFSFLITPLFC